MLRLRTALRISSNRSFTPRLPAAIYFRPFSAATTPTSPAVNDPPFAVDADIIAPEFPSSIDQISSSSSSIDSSVVLPESNSFAFISDLIEMVHATSGLPYWGSVVFCILTARAALFPAFVALQKQAKLQMVFAREMQKLSSGFNPGQVLTKEEQLERNMQVVRMAQDLGFVPLRTPILALLPMPVHISFFFGLRDMATYNPNLVDGGLLWFSNLAVPDPYFILPILNGLLFLAVIETNTTPMTPVMLYAFRGGAVAATVFTAQFPAVLCLYWCTSSIVALIQNNLTRIPAFAKMTDPVLPEKYRQAP